jgi:inosose dehydratase
MTIQIASAPVSWGILEFEGMAARYTPHQVLAEIRTAGYTGTELGPWGFLPTEPHALNALLTVHHLTLISAFVPIRFADPAALDDGEAVALRTAALLAAAGCKIIVLADDNATVPQRTARAGRITAADGLTPDQWKQYCAGVDRVAVKVMDQYGLAVAFHHHCGGWVETPAEIQQLLDGTDPRRVGLCFDTGHFLYGGGDPAAAARDWGARVNHLHFKDCDPAVLARVKADGLNYMQAVAAGVFPELGRGAVDFPAVIAALTAHGYAGWGIVEQDILPGQAGVPLESAHRNRDYLRRLGL